MLVTHRTTGKTTLYVSTTEDLPRHVDRLFRLCQDIEQLPDTALDILIDFHYCNFINHLGVAFLGGLACAIQARGGRLTFDWETLPKRIGMNLAQNGFLYSFGCEQYPWDGNSIPYRSDLDHDFTEIGDYLRDKWLGKGWVNISAGLQNAIAGQVSEIYLNAFEHSRSPIGVFSCGQHYPRAEMLYLTVIDFGIGIPNSVRSFLQNDQIPSTDALEWAFQAGKTTKQDTAVSRGMGLNLLQNFVTQNQGSLQIFSNDGCVAIDHTGIRYENGYTSFTGTLVNIAFRCDETYYCLTSEASDPGKLWF
ncbi:MAG: ATP-binding protein [Cyanobacteria bacterium P01_D01_bin.71]